MIPTKKFGFGERGTPDPSENISLTDQDKENLTEYVAKIRETVTILRDEIDAINDGKLEVVGQVFEEKSKILKWIEVRTPVVEPFLAHEFAQKLRIREHLAELKKNIEEDGAILSRMAVAARTILREIEKINNRNGLGGVYGKTGEKVGPKSGPRPNIDQEL